MKVCNTMTRIMMHEEKMKNLKHVLYKLIMNGKNIAMECNGSCVEEHIREK